MTKRPEMPPTARELLALAPLYPDPGPAPVRWTELADIVLGGSDAARHPFIPNWEYQFFRDQVAHRMAKLLPDLELRVTALAERYERRHQPRPPSRAKAARGKRRRR